jgi:hypothetical protein
MLFYAYWLLTVLIAALIVRALLRERDWRVQVSAALALIPLALRIFWVK